MTLKGNVLLHDEPDAIGRPSKAVGGRLLTSQALEDLYQTNGLTVISVTSNGNGTRVAVVRLLDSRVRKRRIEHNGEIWWEDV